MPDRPPKGIEGFARAAWEAGNANLTFEQWWADWHGYETVEVRSWATDAVIKYLTLPPPQPDWENNPIHRERQER